MASDELGALPQLGTDRRHILATMRRAGLHVIEDTGARVVFDGGPEGWHQVARAVYEFSEGSLSRFTLELEHPETDGANRDQFLRLRSTLSAQGGTPSFDRVRDNDRGLVQALPTDETRWLNDTTETRIGATYGKRRALTLSVARSLRSVAAEELAAIADRTAWAFNGRSQLALATRAASETLLDDFVEQPAITQGAKHKGKPLNVRLKAVHMPTTLADTAQAAVEERFARFAHGAWDVTAVDDASAADVDLVIEVEQVRGSADYAMHLSAVVAHGKCEGQLLYSATLLIKQPPAAAIAVTSAM